LAHRLASFSPSDVRHMMYENGRKLLPVSGS
jgi:hypothetical protein